MKKSDKIGAILGIMTALSWAVSIGLIIGVVLD